MAGQGITGFGDLTQDVVDAIEGGGSPLTTKGDLVSYDTEQKRLGVGSDGQILTADSSAALGVKWGSAGTGLDATSIQSVPVDTAPVGALAHLKTFIAYWYSNLLLWSEDISQLNWAVLSGDTKDGTDGIVASTTSGAHGVYQGITFETGNYTFRAVVSAGDKDYFAMYSSGGGDGFNTNYFQLSTCSVISQLSDAVEINDLGGGECEILVQDAIVAGYKTPYVLASANGTSLAFAGDGSTVSIRVKELQVYKGTIAENFPYQKTTTVAISKQQLDWVDKSEITDGTAGCCETADNKLLVIVDGLIKIISLLLDGCMEKVGIADWIVSTCTLTKETGTRTGGTGKQVLRLTYLSTGSGIGYQTGVITSGADYIVKGWARTSGHTGIKASFANQTTFLWEGTPATTDWEYFEVTFTAVSDQVRLYMLTAPAGGYVEWDDVTVEDA